MSLSSESEVEVLKMESLCIAVLFLRAWLGGGKRAVACDSDERDNM